MSVPESTSLEFLRFCLFVCLLVCLVVCLLVFFVCCFLACLIVCLLACLLVWLVGEGSFVCFVCFLLFVCLLLLCFFLLFILSVLFASHLSLVCYAQPLTRVQDTALDLHTLHSNNNNMQSEESLPPNHDGLAWPFFLVNCLHTVIQRSQRIPKVKK